MAGSKQEEARAPEMWSHQTPGAPYIPPPYLTPIGRSECMHCLGGKNPPFSEITFKSERLGQLFR